MELIKEFKVKRDKGSLKINKFFKIQKLGY